MKFELFRQSWLAEGRSTGLAAPVKDAHFNEEETRWEIEIWPEFFLAYIRDLSMKENVAIKIVFPPYNHPPTDLPIIEILDNEGE